ncbi:unnamed protein product [Linum trigynum]|uniref:Uncharacterized protein n=1 Tax=Linum trigynum TaxID=586398 RepID=A0AAV2CKZ8_9ROSI
MYSSDSSLFIFMQAIACWQWMPLNCHLPHAHVRFLRSTTYLPLYDSTWYSMFPLKVGKQMEAHCLYVFNFIIGLGQTLVPFASSHSICLLLTTNLFITFSKMSFKNDRIGMPHDLRMYLLKFSQ